MFEYILAPLSKKYFYPNCSLSKQIHPAMTAHNGCDRPSFDQKDELRFFAAFEQIAVGIVYVGLDGHFLNLNQIFCNIVGYEPDELALKHLTDVIYVEDLANIKQQFSQLLEQKDQPAFLESRCVCKNGSVVWVTLAISLWHQVSDEPSGFVLVIQDISCYKKMQVELQMALEREQELNTLRSYFVSVASHELRVPLTVVSTSAGILQDFGNRLDEKKIQRHLERIQHKVQCMNQLLDNISLLNLADETHSTFKPILMDIKCFCKNLIEEVQLKTSNHIILFSALNEIFKNTDKVDRKNELIACIDKMLLEQILINVLNNAIKYSPNGGKVYFNLRYGSDKIVFQIKDEGIGIPWADQPKIFDAFYRASNVDQISGTGLGLAVVKKCVDLHRGEIRLISEIDQGTTIIIMIPTNYSIDGGSTNFPIASQ